MLLNVLFNAPKKTAKILLRQKETAHFKSSNRYFWRKNFVYKLFTRLSSRFQALQVKQASFQKRYFGDSWYRLFGHWTHSQKKFNTKKIFQTSPLNFGYNRTISKLKIGVEHHIRKIKCFRIFSERYRCRHKTFKKRFNLICAVINLDLPT